MKRFSPPALLLALILGVNGSAKAAIQADSADDVCATDADPCVIAEPLRIDGATVLDFGLRAVELTGEGRLEFGAHSGVIRCGDFVATTDGDAIDAQGAPGFDVNDDSVRIEARRACNLDPAQPCLDDRACSLGTCSVHICTGSESHTCWYDAMCQAGPCLSSGRCSGSTLTSCSTNADCDLGTCPVEEFSCSEISQDKPKRGCATDADCDLGSCSVGTASITIAGAIEGRGRIPANITLKAADSIVISAPVNVSSRSREIDGGALTADATYGNVSVLDEVHARGGAWGGWLELDAGGDVLLAGGCKLDGFYNGGDVDIEADGNVTIEESIRASARGYAGSGGIVYVSAGGDIQLKPGPDTRKLVISINGRGDQFGDSGDGGDLDLSSDFGNVIVHEGVRILSHGGSPGGLAGESWIEARHGGHIQFDGELLSRGRGNESFGGVAYFDSGTAKLGPASVIVLDSPGGGSVFAVDASGDVELEGTVSARGSVDSEDGEIAIMAGDLAISGQLTVGGSDALDTATLEVDACRIDLLPGAVLSNTAPGGQNILQARESMLLEAGSQVLAKNGTNVLAYRTSDKPPVVDALIDTLPVFELRNTLAGCPVCGNSEIDEFETCDDGNVIDGDGCSATCVTE